MQREYLDAKFENEKFRECFSKKLERIKDKKVLIYGTGKASKRLFEEFSLKDLNIVGYADKKFKGKTEYKGALAIPPEDIKNIEFDAILITLEYPKPVEVFLNDLDIKSKIVVAFEEKDPNASSHFNYLKKIKFEKHLKKLKEIMKDKTCIIYGAGSFFQIIEENYDLNGLNIIAYSDKKWEKHKEGETFLGKKVCSPSEIIDLKPDYVFVGTRWFLNILEYLSYSLLDKTNIKVRPLVKVPIFELLKEIWK